MKYLYKYSHAAFPYAALIEGNRRRGREEPEYELLDTGVFDENRHFDVFVEYAKAAPEDVLIRVTNGQSRFRGWFRNTWSWGLDARKPELAVASAGGVVFHFGRFTYSDRSITTHVTRSTRITRQASEQRALRAHAI